jgi:hypothetical protein
MVATQGGVLSRNRGDVYYEVESSECVILFSYYPNTLVELRRTALNHRKRSQKEKYRTKVTSLTCKLSTAQGKPTTVRFLEELSTVSSSVRQRVWVREH